MSKNDDKVTNIYEQMRKEEPQEAAPEEKKSESVADEEVVESHFGGALEYPSHEEVEAALAAAEAKAEEQHQRALRLQAEINNLQKRAERDVANAHKFGLEKMSLDFLPVLDSLERGLEAPVEDNELAQRIQEGISLTIEMFLKTLEKYNIEQVNPLGEAFNPECHEAMSMQADPSAKPNTVLQVLQKGYTLNGRLIRPALVIVAQA